MGSDWNGFHLFCPRCHDVGGDNQNTSSGTEWYWKRVGDCSVEHGPPLGWLQVIVKYSSAFLVFCDIRAMWTVLPLETHRIHPTWCSASTSFTWRQGLRSHPLVQMDFMKGRDSKSMTSVRYLSPCPPWTYVGLLLTTICQISRSGNVKLTKMWKL